MEIETLPLAGFKQLMGLGVGLDIGAKFVSEGFMVIAISRERNKVYTVRHAREDKPRVWDLGTLAKWLKKEGVNRFEVHQ